MELKKNSVCGCGTCIIEREKNIFEKRLFPEAMDNNQSLL